VAAESGSAPRRVGRPARISREQIVDAAVEIGIEGLTMAAVAERLRTSHQALYRWVRDRDELVALVADVYVQRLDVPPAMPPMPDEDWRAWLRRFARTLHDVLGDIPGFAAEGLGTFRTTLPFLRLNQTALQVLTDAGFAPARAQRIYQTVGTALLGWLVREDAYRPLRADPAPAARAVDATLASADEDLSLVRDTAIGELTSPAEDRYGFLVDTLLAGLPEPAGEGPSRHAGPRARSGE
jgi:AcrR family transcriptional regulator